MEKQWFVPENCPLKKIVQSLEGQLKKDFTCKDCPALCPSSQTQRPVLDLRVNSNDWIINYADEFAEYIQSIKQSKLKENITPDKNPLSSLNVSKKLVAKLYLKGVYPEVKQQIKRFFDFEWNKSVYDVLTCISITSRNSIEVNKNSNEIQ